MMKICRAIGGEGEPWARMHGTLPLGQQHYHFITPASPRGEVEGVHTTTILLRRRGQQSTLISPLHPSSHPKKRNKEHTNQPTPPSVDLQPAIPTEFLPLPSHCNIIICCDSLLKMGTAFQLQKLLDAIYHFLLLADTDWYPRILDYSIFKSLLEKFDYLVQQSSSFSTVFPQLSQFFLNFLNFSILSQF